MDRDAFSDGRRARHFERSNQSYQPNSSPQNHANQLENQSQSYRRNLRDAYLNESQSTEFRNPLSFFGSPNAFINSLLSQNTPDTLSSPSHSFFGDSTSDLSLQLAGLGFEEKLKQMGVTPSISRQSESRLQQLSRLNRLPGLPAWALDENREIRHDLTLKKVVDEGLVLVFSMDKSGCHFLQSNYFGDNTQNVDPYIRERVSREILGSKDVFLLICKNIFGNFFLQRVIEYSNPMEQEIIKSYLVTDMNDLCLDKSACRVVQTALDRLEPRLGEAIVAAIPRKIRLLNICVDQNANHVIQKIVKKMPLSSWEFLVAYLCGDDYENMLNICQDKYGCRVVQTVVEMLSAKSNNKAEAMEKTRALHQLMKKILEKCHSLASNEFANYVIQHIISTPGILSNYRNAIIDTCLLRNLLSMSQEKYASHVIERAFVYAPIAHIAEMMEEIFDGYVPHPETGKDALDILLFHQFGNYVVQRMLEICVTAVTRRRDTIIDGVECRGKFENWLSKLYRRARKERSRLERFSSGKKILDILYAMETSFGFVPSYECTSPFSPAQSSTSAADLFCSSIFSPTGTPSIGWPSGASSITSDQHRDFDFNFSNYSKF